MLGLRKEPLTVLPYATPASPLPSFVRRHWPALMLVLASALWGMGFSWAKNAGDAVNRAADLPLTAAVGHLTQLGIRFSLAAVLWAACSPTAWHGWTWRTVRRGGAIGLMLGVALALQHVGLGLSDEAVIAFLTNLTVILVPAIVFLTGGRRPRWATIAALPVALAGIALMSGLAGGAGHAATAGALWGVACAVAFSVELLLLDRWAKGESAVRLTLMLIGTAAFVCWLASALTPGFGRIRWGELLAVGFLADMGPAIVLTTIVAYGLMTVYQPKVDPSRAAVLYLTEPVFAAAFAWGVNGRTLTPVVLAGGALILAANVIAEGRSKRL